MTLNGIVLAIIGMLILSFSKLTARKAMHANNVLTAAMWIHVIIAATVGVLAIIFGDFAIPRDIPYYLLTVLIGAIAIVPLYVAYQLQGLGLPTAIASAFAPITVLLSVLFAAERFSFLVWIGMIFVFSGVFLTYADLRNWHRPKLQKGLGWAFITMLGWGAYFFLIKKVVDEMGVWPATFALETGVATCIIIFALFRKAVTLPKEMKWIIFTGTLDGIGVLCYYAALQFISISIAATILQVSLVVCAVLAALFLKERFTTLQKMAILMTFVGLVMVTV